MRKLASIQRVLNVRAIPGADKIEVVDVLGWSVVVLKDEFKVGDFCVYFEIDSWCDGSIPAFQAPAFQERYTNWNGKRGMRLKTIKLRKQVSQGLVLRVSDFSELVGIDPLYEDTDVTEILKIEKWEPADEGSAMGGAQGTKTAGAKQFPAFIRKTDQERVQNYIHELGKHSAETFEVSIKLDGSSMTVFHVGRGSPIFAHCMEDQLVRKLRGMTKLQRLWHRVKSVFVKDVPQLEFFGVCSRNIQLDTDGDNHFSAYVRKHNLFDKLASMGENVAVQGELIAPSIQKNYEKAEDFEFYVYDVFDIDKQEYYLPREARLYAMMAGLEYVPVLEKSASLWEVTKQSEPRAVVDALLAHADGPGMNPGVKREGVVWKSNTTPFSFKAISNSYLLKETT